MTGTWHRINRKHIAILVLFLVSLLTEAFFIIAATGWATTNVLEKSAWAKDTGLGFTYVGLQGFYTHADPPLWIPFSYCSSTLTMCNQCDDAGRAAFSLIVTSFGLMVIVSLLTVLRGGYFYPDSTILKNSTLLLLLMVIAFSLAAFLNWHINCFKLITSDTNDGVTISELSAYTGFITGIIAWLLSIFLFCTHMVTPVVYDSSIPAALTDVSKDTDKINNETLTKV